MKIFKISLLFFLFRMSLFGAVIHGTVFDGETKVPMISAYVIIEKTSLLAVTDSKGMFEIRDIHPGDYTIAVSYMGYITSRRKISIGKDVENIRINFFLLQNTT